MRLAIISFVAIIACQASSAADESFPFTAFVAHDRTPARSGPSDDHYATDRLGRGDQVEVYQRVGGGWLAIRPPKTSFSWIAERDVKVDEDRPVGRVIGDHAVSWIGSDLVDVVDHKWQIKLDPDEPVAILGKQRMKMVADGKSDRYFKISPPAGEFRWIHEDDIVRSREELTAKRDNQVNLADFRVAIRGRPRADAAVSNSPTANDTAAKEAVAQGTTDNAQKTSAKDDFVGRDTNASAVTAVPAKDSLHRQRDSEPQPLAADAKDIQTRLTEFDTRLSLLVAQPVEKWDVSQLKADAQQLADRASSTLERARVQLFLDKITSFESLKSKHALFAAPVTPPADKSKDKESVTDNKSAGKAEVDPRFDGTGWLLPVHSTKRAAPPYALLDKDGNILQFVSPAPGLNLNRYLRKEVGIFGQREQASTLDKPHLTANRIVELDRHRR